MDTDDTYYGIVDECLSRHQNLVFWYAGTGDDSKLTELMNKYSERVYFTGERTDLYQIMEHIDVYLNTYPILGGLMTQFAVAAGKLPMTLVYDMVSEGVLMKSAEEEVFYRNRDLLMKELHSVLDNIEYRKEKERRITEGLISEYDFKQNLSLIIEHQKSNYEFDTSIKYNPFQMHKLYEANYSLDDLKNNLKSVGYNSFVFDDIPELAL